MSDQDERKDEQEEREDKKSPAQKAVEERSASDIKTFQRPGTEKRG